MESGLLSLTLYTKLLTWEIVQHPYQQFYEITAFFSDSFFMVAEKKCCFFTSNSSNLHIHFFDAAYNNASKNITCPQKESLLVILPRWISFSPMLSLVTAWQWCSSSADIWGISGGTGNS